MCSPLTEDHMDLNQLLYHHQIALIRANETTPACSGLVDHYARKIRDLRGEMGLTPFAGWAIGGVPA